MSSTTKGNATSRARNAAEESKGRLLYVYCAVRAPVTARALGALPSLPGGSPPRLIALTTDIKLVVADVPRETYRGEAVEARLTDLDWVSRCGTAHHAIADTLVPKHTVVPFRMFTLFENEERARAILSEAAPRIARALERVRGKSEWVLRISLPEPARAASPDGSPKGSKAPVSGTAFLAQKAAAQRSAAERATRVRTAAQDVFDRLSALASDGNRRPAEDSTGWLIDAAFLVDGRQLDAFKNELSSAAGPLLQDGCRVSLTGPWPPYSFVDLNDEKATP